MLLFNFELFAQEQDISSDWKSKTIKKFKGAEMEDFLGYDFSVVLSNQERIPNDRWASYIGVFGENNNRIDFNIKATRTNNTQIYDIVGKSKLGDNIRNLDGHIKLINIRHIYQNEYIMVLEYEYKEPGDRDGDGKFYGIGTVAFRLDDDKPKMFWSAAGNLRQYNNMHIGYWSRYNSDKKVECIFSFMVSGTNTKLPYRYYLYKEFSEEDECKCFYEIKDEYLKYG